MIAVPLLTAVSFGLAAVAKHPVDGFLGMAVDLGAIGAGLALANIFTAASPYPVEKRSGTPTPRAVDGYMGLSVGVTFLSLIGLIALVIGVSLGLLAGYLGGWVDAIVSRMTETAMAFPNVLLGVGLAVVIGPGLLNVVIIIALFTWYYPARIVRSATVSTTKMTFVAAARAVGARPRRLLTVHLLPQVWGPLLVYATSIIAANIIFEAGLSYLGVGVPPPTPSWGGMLSDAVTSGMYQTDIGLALVPGLALVITMLAFNLLGDGIRDALDPRRGR